MDKEAAAATQFRRERILHTLLVFSAIAVPVVLIPSIYLLIKRDLYFIVAMDIGAYGFVLFALFCSKTMPYPVRAFGVSLLTYLVGFVILMEVGPFSAGPVWLFAFPVLCGLLIGNKAALVSHTINAVTLFAIGWALHSGWGVNWYNKDVLSAPTWLVITCNFLILNYFVTLSLGRLLDDLQSALSSEGRLIQELKTKQEQLEASNMLLQSEIGQKKIAVDKLNRSEARYRQLFNEAPVMYVITEYANGTELIKDVNQLFLHQLGYAKDAVINRPLSDFYAEENRPGEGDVSDGPEAQERLLLDGKGGHLCTTMHALPEMNDLGMVVGTRVMFVDITQRKQAEERARILESNAQRSQRIEAIGTLAGGIAHDFNNILTAVIGYSQICLLKMQKDNPAYDKIEAIYHAGERARELVRQILTFSRNSETTLAPIDIGPLIKEVLKLLRASLPSTIELSQKIAPRLPLIKADSTQIHQIIMNLCTNSAHAMEQTGGRLQVQVDPIIIKSEDAAWLPELSPGSYVRIIVEDTGSGIPEGILPRIFEPYFTTKEHSEGTGLGLSVVHGIVKSYKGAVHVTSGIDTGSTFQVFLPALPRQPRQMPMAPAADCLAKGNEHILLVDDEPAVLKMTDQMLTHLGYKVTAFDNGPAAFEHFKSRPEAFDLLFMDMTMPGITGDQLAARSRQIRPDIPILLYTGYNMRLTGEYTRQAGLDDVLMKPFDQAELAKAVRRAIDRLREDIGVRP
jgi:PAS domain S-box-containing protein